MSRLVVGKPLARLPGELKKFASSGTKVMVVADAAVASRVGTGLTAAFKRSGFDASMAVVTSGERSKALGQSEKLYRLLAKRNFERSSWLVAVGGGVVGDLTGFVAATFLRGIPYVQVPTTLLGQVDSSIGGKTGVDIPEGKNLVGSFYHPQLIWTDPALLRTLPARHWRNGLAEVIKYGAIRDAKLFEFLEREMDVLLKGNPADWIAVIKRCAEMKMVVVKKDPVETKGLRAILNFGHSVGHAIEAAGKYKDYLHGEAISIGMVVAGRLSERLSGLQSWDRIRLEGLLQTAGLPVRVRKAIPRSKIFEHLARDKKVRDGAIRFVLLKRLGQAVSGQRVSREALSAALNAVGL